MLYSKLCEMYEKLSATTKGLEKTTIIADFLKHIEKEPETIYLIQGKFVPDYDERESGISEQLAIKAIAKTAGIKEEQVVKEFKKSGDLGLTAEKFCKNKKQSSLFSEKLTTQKILENLRKLPAVEGKGAVDRKMDIIMELLNSASSIEAKYIIRTLLEDLKVGIGSGLIRDAIVKFAFNPKDLEEKRKKAEILQSAYDKSTDFAEVFEKAIKGEKELSKVELSPGKPVKVMLFPKAENIDDAFEIVGKPAAFEYKYDGFRCVTGYTSLYVKDRGFLSARHVKKGDCILSHKGRFKKILAINKRKIDKNEKLFEVQSFYGSKFRISEKHPLLVYRKKPEWINIEEVTKKDKLLFPVPHMNIKFPYEKELILKDESGYMKKILLNDFFFRFLGYWIGDGFTNDYHNTERVGLIFNLKSEKELSEYYEKNIKKIFKIENISRNIHNGAIYLYWRDKPLRLWLSKYFRKEWKGKALPEWFLGINKKQFENFLLGWIESDGHTDKFDRINITTKERGLAMSASLLGLKFEKMIGISKVVINKTEYYRLLVSKSNRCFRLINKDYFAVDILKLEQIKRPHPKTTLYNFQVEDDESYCSSMAILHNCMINKDEKGKIQIFTRRLDNVTKQFPDAVKYVQENVKANTFIIDSEAVGYDPKTKKYKPFQDISQRIKRKYDIEVVEKQLPVELNVFDIIYYNGESLINKPFKERRRTIEKIVKVVPFKIRLAEQIITDDSKTAEKFYDKALDDGQEGLMAKNLNAIYKPGARIGYAVKLKPEANDFDLVITGAEYGTGKRAGWLTSFDVSCKTKDNELLEIGKVSTGLKEKPEEGLSFIELTKELKKIIKSESRKHIQVKPEIVVTVGYQNIQASPTYSSGFALRFPRMQALRPDRGIKDIATLEEVKRAARKENSNR